jgi:hypothetical protein
MQAIANSLNTSFRSTATNGIATFYPTTVQLTEVTVTDIGQAAPAAPGSDTTGGLGDTGTGALPPQICAQINYSIAARYRGGHARSMFPGLAPSFANTSVEAWLSTAINNFQASIAAMWQSAGTAGNGAMCVPTYNYSYTDNPTKKKYVIAKVSVKENYLVNGFTMRPTFGVQRHRGQTGG